MNRWFARWVSLLMITALAVGAGCGCVRITVTRIAAMTVAMSAFVNGFPMRSAP